ncbi:MAG: hypothetical protein KDB61_09230 [Planctomycetes bacterium]|nr:hypothetical protein [Planctomycetota bacterium]
MLFGRKEDKPSELELKLAALQADEHFQGLPEDVQTLKLDGLFEADEQTQRIQGMTLERYKSSLILGMGVMFLAWGFGSPPTLATFAVAMVLGALLGIAMELLDVGLYTFAAGCGLGAFLLGTMTGSIFSMFFIPLCATMVGGILGTSRWS